MAKETKDEAKPGEQNPAGRIALKARIGELENENVALKGKIAELEKAPAKATGGKS